jgi:hypothetical protein
MSEPFNISTFKTKLKDGGARPNQFSIKITFPTLVPSASILLQSSSFLVNIGELPGQTIGVTPAYYRGRELKLAGDKQFSPFTCTILNDTDFILREGLERWMNIIENNETKTGNPSASYFSTIDVHQLDRNGNILRAYQLQGAFPTDISPIGLDFSANDQLSSFGTTFQYQTFTYGRTEASLERLTPGLAA